MTFSCVKRIVHCDWGADDKKRATCWAHRLDDGWEIRAIKRAGSTDVLLQSCSEGLADNERVLVGFDFPIGYPHQFGKAAGLGGFIDALKDFGEGKWSSFFCKARNEEELSLYRPFYPHSCSTKGYATHQKLAEGLKLSWNELFRECERATTYRNMASPLFWTLGAKQVGTAAMLGWREILQPALKPSVRSFGIWPFEGNLESMLTKFRGVIVETYPGEAYSHLGFPRHWSGKTDQNKRRERAVSIFDWADKSKVKMSETVRSQVEDGFGSERSGEDPFDALVGACSMIEVVEGRRLEGRCSDESHRRHEGWIFGQKINES